MAQLGYNLMRIHHHDTWSSVFGPKHKDTRHFSREAMDQLDWWIKCMKDEGIYIWLDMHVGRSLQPSDGVQQGAAEIARGKGSILGFCYYNTEIQNLMKEFQHNYLNHLNPYTKLRYKDDPAVICALITNEDDLSGHHGNKMLPDKNNPVHNALFNREYQAFAGNTGFLQAASTRPGCPARASSTSAIANISSTWT